MKQSQNASNPEPGQPSGPKSTIQPPRAAAADITTLPARLIPFVQEARKANAAALQAGKARETWTPEARIAAIHAYAQAADAYNTLTFEAEDEDEALCAFADKQAFAHHASMERQLGTLGVEVATLRTGAFDKAALEDLRAELVCDLPGWLAWSCGAEQRGGLVTLAILPKGDLRISLNEGAREGVEALRGKRTDEALAELLEDFASSDMRWCSAEELGALTEGPIVTFAPRTNDQGDLVHTTRVYWHSAYQIEDPIQALLEEGHVDFQGEPSPQEPEADPA